MYERNSSIEISQVVVDADVKGHAFLSKVFAYMAFWLLITTIVAVGAGIGFAYAFTHLPEGSGELSNAVILFLVALVVSLVGLIVTGLVINVASFRGKMSLTVPGIIYSVFMGILLSTFVMFIEWYILAMAFGITTLTFAGMYLIAKTTKKNLAPIGFVGYGLLMGAFMLMLIYLVFALINMFVLSEAIAWTTYWLYVAIDTLIFVAILFITMFEMWNIVKIAEKGSTSKNLAQYCAFTLYTDFIYILIRIAIILARIFGSSRR